MSTVYSIFASAATAVGLLGTLMFLVMGLAGAPNSTPQQMAMLKIYWLATGIGGLLCLAGAILLIAKGHPGWGSLTGLFPMFAFFVTVIWVSLK